MAQKSVLIKFWPFKEPCGHQQSENVVQNGQNICWAINVDRKTAIWFTLNTKGTKGVIGFVCAMFVDTPMSSMGNFFS